MTLADGIALALRGASFVAVLQAAGIAMFLWLYRHQLQPALRPVAALGALSNAAGLGLSLAQQLTEPARLAGSLLGVWDPSLQTMLLTSDAGKATGLRLLGLSLLLLSNTSARRVPSAAAPVGAGLIAISFAAMGHTATDEQRWLLAPLLVAHVAVVAFWFGALLPLRITVATEVPAIAGRVVAQFSHLATLLVPSILLAGLIIAALLLPDLASVTTPFGRLLLIKVAGFAALMALAAANKWRFAPRIETGDAHAATVLRRSLVAEWLIIVAVIGVTTLLTGLFSPGHG